MKMAALPSPTQVAGSHYSIYEAYYQLVDPNNQGSVGALDAAKFLKKSGLSDAILSKVWDLSDPNGKGYLNKSGFFVALKLVSLAQIGNDVSIASLMVDTPPPKMGDIPTVLQKNVINSVPATVSDWAMKPTERAKYDQLFDSLQPLNGVIPGNKVKGLLIDSKLPVDTLGRIWDLADMDKDGSLDRHEFVVAMHLVYKALEKYAIPSCLPPELLPPGKRKESISSVPVIPVTSVIPVVKPEPPKPSVPLEPQATWVVSGEERARYDTLFIQTDVDKDGFVSGFEIRDVFLQSGVPQSILAHIWGLCDVKQTGKLNSEQFALSMWLINQKLKGIDPPKVLSPEMVPPCNRNKPAEPLVENNNTTPYSNPELDMITKDIEELVREKQSLESEILQKEADIKIKNGEVKSLQGELDTLAATLKQLESQKGEAQKRLNDLKNQTALIESELSDVNLQLDAEQIQVDNLRRQAEEQEASLKEQEEELVNKKQELEGLKQEETRLEQQQEEFRERLESISQNLQESQLQISQVKASISQVQEQQRQMKDAIALSETAISSGDASSVPDTCLNLQPEFREPSYTRLVSDQGENSNDPFSSLNGPADSGGETFTHNNAFNNDPFQNVVSNSAPDPFASSNHFSSSFTSKPTDAFSSDPFSSFGNSLGKSDPFDPFTDGSNRTATKSPDDMAGKDPFGCDPFASLHPPTSGGPPPRPESPSPALPPKKSKQPPPRPAPPKALLQSTTPSPDPFSNNPSSQSDPFSMDQQNDPFTSNVNPGGFADFSNFNSKCSQTSNLPEPVNFTYNCLVTMSQSEAGVQLVVNFPKQLWSHILKQFSDTTGIEKAAPAVPTVKLDFTEDPFRDYRYEDPFNITDPFDDTPPVRMTPEGSSKLDPFGMEVIAPPQNKGSGKSSPISGKATPVNGKSTPSPLPSEDQQLAWAASESLRLEEERRRAAEQERVDLKRALALSKKEGKKRTSALSRILS